MFFDLGWSEMLVIGAVALVVIGPKELPNALRTAGYWVRKARSLSREFQGSFEQMIREAELDEVRKDLKKAAEFDIESEFRKTVDPTGELAESIKPPDIPDYFDEAPKPAAAAESAPEPATLPAPDEAAGEPAPPAAEPSMSEPSVPEPSSEAPEGAPEAAREPAPSKP